MGRVYLVERKPGPGTTDTVPLLVHLKSTTDMRILSKSCRSERIMDELLLNSHLRRVDDIGDGLVRVEQPILLQKPTTPHIVLPNEARFAPLLLKSRFALDIGGTLIKLVYSTVCRCEENDYSYPEVLLNFKKFLSMETCLDFIRDVRG